MINNDVYIGITYPFILRPNNTALECLLISKPIKVTPSFYERMRPYKGYQKHCRQFYIRSNLSYRNSTNNKL